jgi:hypothetical protein
MASGGPGAQINRGRTGHSEEQTQFNDPFAFSLPRKVLRQEIDGFLEGLFSGEESIDLPERAQRALTVLSEIRGMLEAARSLAIDWTKPASSDDIAGTIRNIGKLTTIAEQEMHATVLSCARARRQMLAAMPATR